MAAASAPDTPFSLGSQGGDLMHLLLRTLARGRDTAYASDPGEAISPAAQLGMTQQPAAAPPAPAARPPMPSARPRGFAAVKRGGKNRAKH